MKWYFIDSKGHGSSFATILYDGSATRQVSLPPIAGEPRKRYSILRIPLPPNLKRGWKRFVTTQEFQQELEELCKLAPDHTDAIRQLPPDSKIGHLHIWRTGPACPEIFSLNPCIARESLKARLPPIRGVEFFPAYLKKIVPIKWELGEPLPKEFTYYEPESYILDRQHSPRVANQMGNFYEVVLPEQPWYLPDRAPASGDALRFRFRGFLAGRNHMAGHGIVTLSIPILGDFPWFRSPPGEDKMFGVYDFVREDLCQTLRDAGRWTLELQEVELL